MRRVAPWLSIALLWMLAGTASAQLADGRRFLERADFTRAVRAFDRAERGAHLTRDDLIAIYQGRAMARWAQGNETQAERDLAALAEIDVHHAFPPEAPPELGEAFADAARAGGLSLELSFTDDASTSTVTVDVHRDDAGLVRTLRTHVRVADGVWSESDASTVQLDVPTGAAIEAWVEAIGPGGAVIGTSGSESAPVTHGGGPVHELEAPAPQPAASLFVNEDAPHDDTGLWIGLGVGIGVAVVLAIVIGVAVGVGSAPSDQTQPDAPVVRF